MWTLRVKPLSPDEEREVAGLIDGRLLEAFGEQSVADQRHGLEAARHVRQHGGSPELVVAALVHDLAKRHARLGTIGRVVASVLARLRLPAPGRLGVYLDHPARTARELRELGLEGLAVEYARHHHGPRPASIERNDWDLLEAADSTFTGRRIIDN